MGDRKKLPDQFPVKEHLKMHAADSTGQLKNGSDNLTTISPKFTRKKRDRGDWESDPVKKTFRLKVDGGDSSQPLAKCKLQSEISLITEKGGLTNYDSVVKLVRLMQSETDEGKFNLASRKMLVDVISATATSECLGQFLELKGASVLNAWIQEVHEGKNSVRSNSSKESPNTAEELIFALLRALDKLPFKLQTLSGCTIGKSVNQLRKHKNLEISKKSRSLVAIWKKRVNAEMNLKPETALSNTVSCPSKPDLSVISHEENKSPDLPMKSATTMIPLKSVSVSAGSMKFSSSSPVLLLCPLLKEDKDGFSSHSQNNSQSCSSDLSKAGASPWKEDARSSTSGASGHPQSSNQVLLKATTEKMSLYGLTQDGKPDIPRNNHEKSRKLIIKLSNRVCRLTSDIEGSLDNPSALISGASFPNHTVNHAGRLKENGDASGPELAADLKTESWQSNDVKDVLTGFDEGDGSLTGTTIAACSSSGTEKGIISGEPNSETHETTLVDHCVKCSEASAMCIPSVDNVGMKLLASVAVTEMAKYVEISPIKSSVKNLRLPSPDSGKGSALKLRPFGKDVGYSQGYSNDANMKAKGEFVAISCSEHVGKQSEAKYLCEGSLITASSNDEYEENGHADERITERNKLSEPKTVDQLKSEGALDVEVVCSVEQVDVNKTSKAYIASAFSRGDDLAEVSALSVNATRGTKDKLDRVNNYSSSSKLSGPEAEEKEERSSNAEGSSPIVKFDFDLNYTLPMEGESGDDIATLVISGSSSAVHYTRPARGAFLWSENLYTSKVEHGWKGSAATSAFRPPKPKKVFELPRRTAEVSRCKQSRSPLDDLNIAEVDMKQNKVIRSSVGAVSRSIELDVDLNMAGKDSEVQLSVDNNRSFKVPLLPVRSSFGGFSNGIEGSSSRVFNPNHGFYGSDYYRLIQRMFSSREINMHFSGNNPSPIATPILHGRQEQNYPVAATLNIQRNLDPYKYPGGAFCFPPMMFSPGTQLSYPGFLYSHRYPNPLPYVSGSNAGFIFPSQLVSGPGSYSNGRTGSSRMRRGQGVGSNSSPGNGADSEERGRMFPGGVGQHSDVPYVFTEEQLRQLRLLYQTTTGEMFKRKEP